MHFSINLATRTYIDRRLVTRVAGVLCALLLSVLAWNIYRVGWNSGELRRLKSDIAAYQAKLNSRPRGVSAQQYDQMQVSVKFYNDIILRKTFSWLGLLDLVENSASDGIALSLVTPDRASGDIKIEGRAKSFSQLKTYMDKMEDSRSFGSIMLLSHTPIDMGERTKGVQFSITCRAVQP